jgi:hypothetical protein
MKILAAIIICKNNHIHLYAYKCKYTHMFIDIDEIFYIYIKNHEDLYIIKHLNENLNFSMQLRSSLE